MTDKQLKSMNKLDLLTVMLQRELEIERLTAEKEELKKRLLTQETVAPVDSGKPAEIIAKPAKEAADLYLKSIVSAGNEKFSETAGQKYKEIKSDISGTGGGKTLTELRIISYLYMNFIRQSHSVMHEMLERYALLDMLQVKEPVFADKPGKTAKSENG